MARWKARGRLRVSADWTFPLDLTVEALWADIGRNRYYVWRAGGHFERKFKEEWGVAHQQLLALEW